MQIAFDEFVQALAACLGLDPVQLAQCQELVVDDLEVGFLHEEGEGDDPGDFVFFSRLGAPQPVHEAAVHKILLQANSLWLGTAGFTLGLHAGSGDILLCGRWPLVPEATPEAFMQVLDPFVATALLWRSYIDGSLELNNQPPETELFELA